MAHKELPLPSHHRAFYPNLGLWIAKDGFATSLNLFNYFNPEVMGAGCSPRAALAEISLYDCKGRQRLLTRRRVEPYGSLHMDLADTLAATTDADCYGAIVCRLIPEQLPVTLVEKPVSTEFLVEITSPQGDKSIVHNLWAATYGPHYTGMNALEAFTDSHSTVRYLVFINNNFASFPLLTDGRAYICVRNASGDALSARTQRIPARGALMLSMEDHFPNLAEFLGGTPGKFEFLGYNLMRKPLAWFVGADGAETFCVDHF